MNNKVVLSIKVTPEFKKAMIDAAKRDEKKLAQFIRKAIAIYMGEDNPELWI